MLGACHPDAHTSPAGSGAPLGRRAGVPGSDATAGRERVFGAGGRARPLRSAQPHGAVLCRATASPLSSGEARSKEATWTSGTAEAWPGQQPQTPVPPPHTPSSGCGNPPHWGPRASAAGSRHPQPLLLGPARRPFWAPAGRTLVPLHRCFSPTAVTTSCGPCSEVAVAPWGSQVIR